MSELGELADLLDNMRQHGTATPLEALKRTANYLREYEQKLWYEKLLNNDERLESIAKQQVMRDRFPADMAVIKAAYDERMEKQRQWRRNWIIGVFVAVLIITISVLFPGCWVCSP